MFCGIAPQAVQPEPHEQADVLCTTRWEKRRKYLPIGRRHAHDPREQALAAKAQAQKIGRRKARKQDLLHLHGGRQEEMLPHRPSSLLSQGDVSKQYLAGECGHLMGYEGYGGYGGLYA